MCAQTQKQEDSRVGQGVDEFMKRGRQEMITMMVMLYNDKTFLSRAFIGTRHTLSLHVKIASG